MTACAWRLVVLALVHLMRATPMAVPGMWWWCDGLAALLAFL